MKKLLLLLFLIPNLVMGEESYYPKSCKSLPVGTEVILDPLGFNEYSSDAIREGLKDELVWVFGIFLGTHFGCYNISGSSTIEECRKHLNYKVRLDSFSYDLNGDGVDEVFTEVNAPSNCGTAGCPVYLIQKINGKWTIGLEDKAMNIFKSHFVYSRSRLVIVNEKINGYKVIYLRGRDYGVNEPGECPYGIGKYTYDKKIQTYKTKGYK